MNNHQIPIVYFPLRLIFVDDNPNILEKLCNHFKDKYCCNAATSVDEALNIINNAREFNYNIFTYEDNSERNLQAESNFKKFSINIDNILSLVENTAKYDNIGIVITDYKLEIKNGLELCMEIRNKYLKKILLTGQLDTTKGINAMNKQIIDRYIKKGSESLIQDLTEYIEVLHMAYFNQLLAINNNTLLNSDLYALDNSDYIELFKRTLLEQNIREFYLIDSKGSFLMINHVKERFVINIHTNKSLDEFIETYKDEKHIGSLIDGVKSRNLIPFFGVNIDPTSIELAQWHKHFYIPQTFKSFLWNWIKL